MQSNTNKPLIVYFYDALCGWCYGFSPVIQKLEQQYGSKVQFEVVSGGMILEEREGPIGEVAPYIKSAYKTVEQHTGVTFGEGFLKGILEPGKARFSSRQPALALSAFKQFNTGKNLSFAAALQKAVYFDGIEPDNPAAYMPYAKAFGVDETQFAARMAAPETTKAAESEFALSAQSGVRGFPTVIWVHKREAQILSNGYLDYKELSSRVDKALKKLP